MDPIKYDDDSPQSHRERLAYYLAKPDLMDIITTHVANGGSLVSIAETWKVSYGPLYQWIHADEKRKEAFAGAIVARGEWEKEKLLHELRQISGVDIRQVFTDDFTIKPPSEWPPAVAAAIASMDVSDITEGSGDNKVKIGELRKIKLHPKIDAIVQLGKQYGLFNAPINVKVTRTLEDVLSEANKTEPEGTA